MTVTTRTRDRLSVVAMVTAAAAMVAAVPATVPAAAAATVPAARFSLPPPTGRHPVGTTELHLVDRGRPDPWMNNRQRELMVSVWYPARRGGEHPRAPYLRPKAAALFDVGASQILGVRPGQVDWAGVTTNSGTGAPADGAPRSRPVVLYSPGFFNERILGTVMAEELASQGYIVVTVDHTYEAHAVEFPGGRVEVVGNPPLDPACTSPAGTDGTCLVRAALPVRVRDLRFVLDELTALSRGHNPDAERRRLPDGLGRVLDLSRVGAFGHSAGGFTAAEAMDDDRRIDAGASLDGPLGYSWTDAQDLGDAARRGLDRPFLLIGGRLPDGTPQTHHTSPSWKAFWEHSTGWKLDLNVPDGKHYTFTDLQAYLPELAEKLQLPAGVRERFIGTVDPARIMAAQRVYLTAFVDQHLRCRPQPILDGPSPAHPDVIFVR